MKFGNIEPLAFGMALGFLSGISACFSGAMILLFNTRKTYSGIMGSVTLNYDMTWAQCLLGGLGVGISTFLASYLAAFAYNIISKKLSAETSE